MALYCDLPVVRLAVWHRTQPILLNRAAPFISDAVAVVGAGGSDSRMKAAKFTVSAVISDAVPSVVPKLALAVLGFRMLVSSSGVPLNTQPETAARSLGNSSLATPCSTL